MVKGMDILAASMPVSHPNLAESIPIYMILNRSIGRGRE